MAVASLLLARVEKVAREKEDREKVEKVEKAEKVEKEAKGLVDATNVAKQVILQEIAGTQYAGDAKV